MQRRVGALRGWRVVVRVGGFMQASMTTIDEECIPLGPPINTDIVAGTMAGRGIVAVLVLALAVLVVTLFRGLRRRTVSSAAVVVLLAASLGLASTHMGATAATNPTDVNCVETPGPGSDSQIDSDSDGLPDVVEARFGSDPTRYDTDDDGLTDVEELRSLTDPTRADTDGDGIQDPAEDTDGDSLTNLSEVRGSTSPADEDSDDDGLLDGDEPTHRTDPTNPDTDGDGTTDGDEVALGSDPLVADPDQVFTHTVEAPSLGASVLVSGSARAVLSTRVVSATDQLGSVAGAIGTPVAIVSDGDLIQGTITFTVDPQALPAGDVAVLHFDEDTGQLDQPPTQSVDRGTGTVTVETESFSPFVLVALDEFRAVWEGELDLPREGDSKNIAAMLALDSSGSMAGNDPADLRKDAAKQFVDVLVSGDLVGAVDFDSYVAGVQPLTDDFGAVKAFIDTIDSWGGTNIGAAVRASLDELDAGSGPDRARVTILLTDGLGSYDPGLTDRAVDSGTIIYTVGLGADVDDVLLQSMADATGGKYFKIEDADQLGQTYDDIGGDIGSPDTDGDGLSDKAETDGWRTQRGNIHVTDPLVADTDGDGLTDGEEAGDVTTSTWGSAYVGISDPTAADTDGDGLDDPSEYLSDTSVWAADTDADGLTDFTEYEFGSDPTQNNVDGDSFGDAEEHSRDLNPMEYDLTGWESAGAAVAGFTFGDWEWGARTIARQNDQQMQSFPYLAGQLASGVAVIGDIRDFIAGVGSGNWTGAALSGAGLIPFVGDGAKIGIDVAKFAGRGENAAKAAYRYIYQLPVSHSAKRQIAASAIGSAARVLPKALAGGPASTYVYIGTRSGQKVYAGITNNLVRRQGEHASRFRIDAITPALTRGEARAIEQAMIVRAGGPKTPGFLNKINSISPMHYYYDDAVEWGEAWLRTNGIAYP